MSSAPTVLPSTPKPTPLRKIIADGIKATGPIPLATYMQLCLGHPTQGYYMDPTNDIFGAKGDFVTSPEMSSVFGEIVGVWLVFQWLETVKQSGKMVPLRLVELGPGRGILLHDILRVAKQFGAKDLQSVHLVETSATLRALQATRLKSAATEQGFALQWHDLVEQIEQREDVFTAVVAHEFFDALPFHLLERTEQGWQEILVALAEEPNEAQNMRYVLSPQPSAASTLLGNSSARFAALPVGSRIQVSPVAFRTMRSVGSLIAGPTLHEPKGCGLIIDYGDAGASSNSFRAFRNHQIVDPFDEPGKCDLTVNVDFGYLSEAVADIVPVRGPLTQAAFLQNMGLSMRVQALLAKHAGGAQKEKDALMETAARLLDPQGMGGQYKVLGLGGAGADVWPFVPVKEEKVGGLEQ
uniref:Protein arginine methyltransferase NDUFAF7 n=1 Tax=Mycena chlorophos TaxID=658473 RepID=A0ABQ0LH47_MYCCL|nr:predicted protein [Mycena chlorophos]